MFREIQHQYGPTTEVLSFDPWPEMPAGGVEMEFRLVYSGRLPAASQNDSRVRDKHDIRRVLGKQLAELWSTHPRLKEAMDRMREGTGTSLHRISGIEVRAHTPEVYQRCHRNFVPLIENRTGVGCSLDILFLRRDHPGALIRSGGDIDNRIKVLFDALRLPSSDTEVCGKPEDDDDPFFCLLEDDRLITEVKVTSDRLLTPAESGEHLNDVRLVIHVRTVVIDGTKLAALTF